VDSVNPNAQSKSSEEQEPAFDFHSATASPSGSPPTYNGDSPITDNRPAEYFPAQEYPTAGSSSNAHYPPPPTQQPAYNRSIRPRAGTRSASKGGGVQVVLDETGSWSELANQSTSIPAGEDGGRGARAGQAAKPTGMLGFLSRKSGRQRSPKPTERGVLGKEGARVVISSGR